VASQLTANIAISGGAQAQADLQAMGTSSNQAQNNLNQLQNAAKDVSSILSSRMSAELKNAQSGLQDLAVRADAAGLDVSKFASLQMKASESAARLGVAQAQSAAAMEKANLVTADASSSAEKVALAQSKATLAAENVKKAELAAGDAMAMVQGEATRLADAMGASGAKGNLFTSSVASMHERMSGLVSGFTGAIGSVLEFGSKLGMTIMGVQGTIQMFASIGHTVGSMIGDYQQNLTKLTTTAGESQRNITAVGKGMLDMAGPTATSIKDLSAAMYWIESGGAHGAAGLTDLKIAAMGAKAEQADLTDVSKVLMFTLNNFESTGLTAASAMNTLIAGVGQGSMTLQQLSGAISNVMPTARTFGISLTDIVAGLDTMTKQGDDASQAATHLAMMIKTIEAPSKAGADALHSVGLTTQQVTDEMRKSLPDAIDMIVKAMKAKFPEGSTAYNEALKAISGGSKSMAAIMETSGTQMDTFRQSVTAIDDAVKKGGTSIAGWSDVQQNFNFRMDQAKAAVGALGVQIGTALVPMATQLVNTVASVAIPALTRFGDWFVNVGIPAIGQFGAFFHDNFAGLGPVIADIARQINKLEFSQWQTELPIVKAIFDALGAVLTSIIIPAIQQFTMGIDKMLQFLNQASLPAQIVRDLLFGIGVAIATINIAAFVAAIPAIVAGFFAWAGAAGLAAVATIAATWPILAIGAAIAVVVAGILLAVQHWGDIMGWISGKTEQTRIKVEEEHTKMAIAMDAKTANGATAAINNMEVERQGILQKLSQTTDEVQRAQLTNQLNQTNAQIKGQEDRLQKAEEDKKKQLAKQKELHDQMVEAQKPWFVRMWDGISGFFGNIGHWFADRFTDAKNGIAGVFGNIGHWFGDRWHDVENIWGGAGKWFGDRFTDAFNWIKGVFGGIGQWFHDRWNELPAPLKATLAYIGDVFQTTWNILVALWGKLGAKFQEWAGDAERPLAAFAIFIGTKILEAWNAVVGAFQFLGKWFGDRWNDASKPVEFFVVMIGGKINEAWGKVVGVFQFLGKWFQDRWNDVSNGAEWLKNTIGSKISDAWNKVITIFSPLGKTFQGWWNDVASGVDWLKNTVGNKFNELKVGVSNIFHDMINGIVDHLNDGISSIEGFINFFGKGLDDIATSLGTRGTIPMAHLGRIPHYAEGTDEHQGGFAVVGERGRELVHLPKGAKVAPNDATEALLAMLGGKIPGYADGIGDLGSQILGWLSGGAKTILDNVISSLHIQAPNLPGMSNISSGIFDTLKNWALSWVTSILPKFDFGGQSVNIPGNVQSWIEAAMTLTSVLGSWAGPLGTIAMHESGGNPNAVNLNDINAQQGHPSQGLFQMIPGTFAAHALPGHTNILNPIDNAASAIGYIKGSYGDVFNVPGIESLAAGKPYIGYANGGVIDEPIAGMGLRTGTRYAFGERGKELVTPYILSQSSSNSQQVIHIHNYIDGKEITNNSGNRIIKSVRTTGPIRSGLL